MFLGVFWSSDKHLTRRDVRSSKHLSLARADAARRRPLLVHRGLDRAPDLRKELLARYQGPVRCALAWKEVMEIALDCPGS